MIKRSIYAPTLSDDYAKYFTMYERDCDPSMLNHWGEFTACFWQEELQEHIQEERARKRSEQAQLGRKKSRLRAKAIQFGIKAWSALADEFLQPADIATLENVLHQQGWLKHIEDAPDLTSTVWHLCIDGQSCSVSRDDAIELLRLSNGSDNRLCQVLQLFCVNQGLFRQFETTKFPGRYDLGRLLAGYRWLEVAKRSPSRFSPSVARFLVRLPQYHRYAVLHKLTTRLKSVFDLRDLNWTALKQARASPQYLSSILPLDVQWHRLTGEDSGGLRLSHLHGFKLNTYRELRKQLPPGATNQESTRGNLQAYFNLVRLFGDLESVRRFVRNTGHPWTVKGLHDAGQFTLPGNQWTPELWAPVCLRHKEAVTFTANFAAVESNGSVPQTLTDLRRSIARLSYPKPSPGCEHLLDRCLNAGVPGASYKTYEQFWNSVDVKTAEFLPQAVVNGSSVGISDDWRFEKLAADDYRGPLLGELTGCCQHLMGAGAATASAGVKSPYSAFYVVTLRGKIMAQAWVWRTAHGDAVIDSVESKLRTAEEVQPVLKLFVAGAQAIQQSALGICAVYLGDTTSGITGQLLRFLGNDSKGPVHKNKPADDVGYFDGRTHTLMHGTPRKGRQKNIPNVEGYKRSVDPLKDVMRRVELINRINDMRDAGYDIDARYEWVNQYGERF